MSGVSVSLSQQHSHVLTPKAQQFLATLHRTFNGTRLALLQTRKARTAALESGSLSLDFLPESAVVRSDPVWQCAAPGPGLADRRVEITGPVTRKMVINALNSGAATFMADFEDSTSPTWAGILDGQANLMDANRRTIDFVDGKGKRYALNDKVATLLVRPRGWHMVEKHFIVDGSPISASLFDFGLYFYNNAHQTIKNGAGPYFYLPKMESHLEARLWNDVFNLAQDTLSVPRGTIRGTVLIETIWAAFEMEEILYELRAHSSGLNCGRWDYIFSFIKAFKADKAMVLPNRGDITMTSPFMSAYVKLLIKTCHARGVHAMGGMAAQIPIKNDPVANDAAMQKVRVDKLREVQAGHDGTWVAHPDLVKVALGVFDEHMVGANQLYHQTPGVKIGRAELLDIKFPGRVTDAGVRENAYISLVYTSAWLSGNGCVPIHNLMEDAATAEISRTQLYQWVRHGVKTVEGSVISKGLVYAAIDEQVGKLGRGYEKAATVLKGMVDSCPDFITTTCYDLLCETSDGNAKL